MKLGKIIWSVIGLLGVLLVWNSVPYIAALQINRQTYAETALVGMVGLAVGLLIIAVSLWFLLRRRKTHVTKD